MLLYFTNVILNYLEITGIHHLQVRIGFPTETLSRQLLRTSLLWTDAKRLIGRRFEDPSVQSDMKHWPFAVVNEGGKPKLKVDYKGETKQFFPEEISSMVLVKMKETAQAYLGKVDVRVKETERERERERERSYLFMEKKNTKQASWGKSFSESSLSPFPSSYCLCIYACSSILTLSQPVKVRSGPSWCVCVCVRERERSCL